MHIFVFSWMYMKDDFHIDVDTSSDNLYITWTTARLNDNDLGMLVWVPYDIGKVFFSRGRST